MDKYYRWEFSEVSVFGVELNKFDLGRRDEKIFRLNTKMEQLRFECVANVRFEAFMQQLNDKKSPNIIKSSNPNLLDELERLARLKEQGLLSDKEFESFKAKLLG